MGAEASKSEFQTSVARLARETVPESDSEFWPKLFATIASVDDVFSGLSVDDLRQLKQNRPENLKSVFVKSAQQFTKVLTPKNGKLINTTQDLQIVTNCVRLLTRIFPVLWESDSEAWDSFFWNASFAPTLAFLPTPQDSPAAPASSSTAPAISSVGVTPPPYPGEGTPASASPSLPPASFSSPTLAATASASSVPAAAAAAPLLPLAVSLVSSLVALLFLPEYTISSQAAPNRGFLLPLDHVWSEGVGVREVLPSTTTHFTHRTEILKCLLACFSQTLYVPPDVLAHTHVNKWLHLLACSSTYHSLALFYSLVNVGCNYDPIGWGIPYNHLLFSDYQEDLGDISVQVLSLLLNYNTESAQHPPSPSTGSTVNVYIAYLRELHRAEDFSFLLSRLVRLLNNPIVASRTYLPNSTKQIHNHQEFLMLFCCLVQENKAFLDFVVQHEDLLNIVRPILHFIHEGRKDPGQLGLIHLGTFILIVLSAKREFCVRLSNQPLVGKLTLTEMPHFTGNHADLLILVLYKLFIEGQDRIEPLYECLLTIIANVSPYTKSLSMLTSIKLLNLFTQLAKPSFLFSSERAYRYVLYVLEAFNNILQYQYEGNSRLVYAILRNQDTFHKLARISVQSWKPKQVSAEASVTAASSIGELTPIAVAPSNPSDPFAPPPGSTSAPPAAAAPPKIEDPFAPPPTPSDTPLSPADLAATEKESEATSGSSKPEKLSTALRSRVSTFTPTEAWLNSWREQLDTLLGVPLRVIDVLTPRVSKLMTGSAGDENRLIQHIQTTTMVGLLPVPHPIVIRKYTPNKATDSWFNIFMWGVIYKRSSNPPLFIGTKIRLFTVTVVNTSAVA